MIYEIAELRIKPGAEGDFERGVKLASPHFQQAQGCRSLVLQRTVEDPLCYFLVVGWDTVDDHMVRFRGSPAFQVWRDLVGQTFAAPPQVRHVEAVLQAF